MPRYYPIFLDVQDRKAVVFGGDHEAERKVRYLIECGANVTLVGPESDLTSRPERTDEFRVDRLVVARLPTR